MAGPGSGTWRCTSFQAGVPEEAQLGLLLSRACGESGAGEFLEESNKDLSAQTTRAGRAPYVRPSAGRPAAVGGAGGLGACQPPVPRSLPVPGWRSGREEGTGFGGGGRSHGEGGGCGGLCEGLGRPRGGWQGAGCFPGSCSRVAWSHLAAGQSLGPIHPREMLPSGARECALHFRVRVFGTPGHSAPAGPVLDVSEILLLGLEATKAENPLKPLTRPRRLLPKLPLLSGPCWGHAPGNGGRDGVSGAWSPPLSGDNLPAHCPFHLLCSAVSLPVQERVSGGPPGCENPGAQRE